MIQTIKVFGRVLDDVEVGDLSRVDVAVWMPDGYDVNWIYNLVVTTGPIDGETTIDCKKCEGAGWI